MSRYSDQKAELATILGAVTGIGRVYAKRPNTTDDKKFRDDYVSSDIVNAVFYSRVDGQDLPETELGSVDETAEILATEKRDYWELTLLYGYSDGGTPSEDGFQELVEAIENAFRFLQDLNDKADYSYPLQRTVSGVFAFFGDTLCHKAVWRLEVVTRIINQ